MIMVVTVVAAPEERCPAEILFLMLEEFDYEKTDVEKFSLYQTGIRLQLHQDRRTSSWAHKIIRLFNKFTCQISAGSVRQS
jgi:hypothetical protein